MASQAISAKNILSSVGFVAGLYYAFKQKKGAWGYIGFGILGSVAFGTVGGIADAFIFKKDDIGATTVSGTASTTKLNSTNSASTNQNPTNTMSGTITQPTN